MAVQSKSNLLAKYGPTIAKAVDAHKGDETVSSNFGELPAGIENGVAKLVDCKFDVYKEGDMAGEVYFYAAGVVVLPTHLGDVPVEGGRTSIMEPVCATPSRKRQTIDQHVQWILNQLRLLGLNTANMTVQHLEPAVEALKKMALNPATPVYFRFRTWKGKPQTTGQYAGQEPRTNHDWLGVVQYQPSANGEAAMTDETGRGEDQSEPSAQPPAKPQSRMTKTKANGKATHTQAPPVSDGPVFDDGADDLDALAEAAEQGDNDAKVRLTELAESSGCDLDAFKDVDTWAEGVALIREAQEVTGGDEAGAIAEPEQTGLAEDEAPEKDQLWKYAPTNKAGRKLPPVECVVTAVSTKKSTVDLKAVKGGAEYAKVPWSELITA